MIFNVSSPSNSSLGVEGLHQDKFIITSKSIVLEGSLLIIVPQAIRIY